VAKTGEGVWMMEGDVLDDAPGERGITAIVALEGRRIVVVVVVSFVNE